MALAALRSLPEASVVVFDQDLRFILAAGQALAREGFDIAELEGRPMAEALPAERWAFWEPIYRAALRGEPASLEIRGADSDRWYHVDVSQWRDGEDAGGLVIARDITERRLAQDRLGDLLDAAPDAMVVTDGSGRILRVNAQTERLFGYDRGELQGQPIDVLLTASAARAHDRRRSRMNASAGTEPEPRLELTGVHSNGARFPVEAALGPLQADTGVLISTAIRDVSDRKRLEAHASHLAAVVESSVDAIISTRPNGEIVSWNQGAERLYGYHEDEVVGLPLELLVPDGQPDELSALRRRVIAGEPVDRHQTVRRRRDGSLVDVTVTISALRDGDGCIVGTSTIEHDITAAKTAETALAQARKDIDRFFGLALDLMVIVSVDGRFIRVNPAVVETLGYSPEELTGRRFVDFLHPDDVALTLDAFASQAAGNSVAALENRYRCKDGSYRWLLWSATAVEDGMVFATALDVTERRLMEDELRSSRERALETSRLKSEFVANMSHEIRTPLNGVVSMAELLLGTRLSGEQAEYAQVALTSAEALMRVINDILDFSKIEAGKLEIVKEDFSIRAAVEDVVEIAGVGAVDRGLELDVVVEDDVADVLRGDGSRIRQVLTNLVSNAIKFTVAGRVTVTAGVEESAGAGEQLRLEVADTGIGIDPAQLPALFAPFSQADATTTRRYGGTGLGLCISKQLVELMGGRIGAHSAPGQGSRFWFTVPYEPGAGFGSETLGSDLTGTRVLVVDDVAADRQAMERRLTAWGISPDSAFDALSALRQLRRATETGRPFEAALIDLSMPEMDGLELARAIKAVPALRSTRLILVTASPVPAAEAEAAGIEAQLVKPVRQSRLYDQLVTVLHKERAAPSLVPAPTAEPAAGSAGRGQVLLVEDNQINQFAAVRLLQTLGFRVDVAANGRQAIAMTARTDYAAVFMDCQMPDVDGYTAARVIRRRERHTDTHLPIVALTAHALEGDRQKCLDAGMDDYVAKPLRVQTIQALIDRLPGLGGRRPPAPAAPGGDDDGELFDPSLLSEIGDRRTEGMLVAMFIEQASKRLPALASAIAAGDSQRLHSLAHGLKGSAATVGANRMSELSRQLCELGEAAPVPATTELHSRLVDALAQTSAAMNAYVAGAAA